jgi:pilus assembly protein CpaB
VLNDVRVIAIDQRLESKAGEAVVAHTATLEVTPKQSEVIALAGEIGKLSLSLRSLVSAASDAPAPKDSAGGPETATLADSSDGTPKPTFTLDSEISPLLPKSLHGNDNSDAGTITILRGNGKGADSIALPASPRGS